MCRLDSLVYIVVSIIQTKMGERKREGGRDGENEREREPVLVQSGMKDQHLRMSSALQEYMHTHTCVNTSHDAPISMACPGVEG